MTTKKHFHGLRKEKAFFHFTCKNKHCAQEFEPKLIFKNIEQKVFFVCPYCDSVYKAHYVNLLGSSNNLVISITKGPDLIEYGTKLACS